MSTLSSSCYHPDHPQTRDTRNLTLKSTGGVSFQYFWALKDKRAKLSLILLLSVLSGCLNFFFVERAGIYNPGIFSVWQSLARLLKSRLDETSGRVVYLVFFWGINSIMNIVLALLTYKGIGIEMTKLSICFIVGSATTGLILSNLPTNWNLQQFYLFSNPFSSTTNNNGSINFLTWDTTENGKNNTSGDAKGIIILFMYAVVFSILNSLIASLLYALEACSGGVDWIIFYLFKTKSYFANKLMFHVGLSLSAFSYIVGSYLPWALGNGSNKKLVTNFFSPLFFALLSSLFVRKIVFKIFYPRFEYVSVKIFTGKLWEIRAALIEEKFRHSFTIVPSYGSYLLRAQYQLEFVCLLIELQELVRIIRKIDKDCFICSLPVRSLNAKISI
ncbi:DUF2179 domain-containing protein [Candidatus Mycoplasma haematominutum]|uniref:DUF2179 domain-containing protein n=1 Tax=Candidatus Mycoplasma haematominutum 'Birmingham 1' TaxID=1116213 RepID=G8C2I9_9MOLU|nr:DUF2179 domain-containing protein [Candidatus Mycoplasma haematominutum]CCE66537.1 conserved hypothetical protein (MG443-like) [Candidatus Mycoplasma haematominutum 'Birmingham 1']